MIVNFVSECEKNALSKTARVLDGFANRIGEKTWQSVMTADGLQVVKQQLRRIATKNTAVLCYALRDQLDTEWFWIVGNHRKFIAPSKTHAQDYINVPRDATWQFLPLIKSITALAALFHDVGKAAACFQETHFVNGTAHEPLRHEWVSCLVFNAFVNGAQTDQQWLERFISGEIETDHLLSTVANNPVQRPFKHLPPVACLINWLILSHHRLPLPQNDWRSKAPPKDFTQLLSAITADFGYRHESTTTSPALHFPHGLLSQQPKWQAEVKKWALKLHHCHALASQMLEDDTWRLALHHARLALMLSDHASLLQTPDAKYDIFKPVNKHTGDKTTALEVHIQAVLENVLKFVHVLPEFESQLPCVHETLEMKKAPLCATSAWQEKAVSAIKTWRETSAITSKHYGFFAVNMATDTQAKLAANAAMLRALSPDFKSLRGVFALGSANLTLQTGEQYRKHLGLDNLELAIVTGTKIPTGLYKSAQALSEQLSMESLLNDEVDFDGNIFEGNTAAFFNDARDKKFLYAPVLACTIDSFICATQTAQGHHHILPSLRLMSSDLVLEDIEQLDGDALIALGRLIHLAGMLGRKVILSSSQLTPELAEGYFSAYQSGWQIFSRSRGSEATVGCAWVNDATTQIQTLPHTKESHLLFREHHNAFIENNVTDDAPLPVRHQREEIVLDNFHSKSLVNAVYYQHIRRATLHPRGDKKISFGLLNMASTHACIEAAEFLMQYEWPDDTDIKILLHHPQQTLLMRNEQEQYLDDVLYQGTIHRAIENPIIAKQLETSTAEHVIYLVVTNVHSALKRDYAFDWSILSPSSCLSSAQLAVHTLTAYDKKGAENLAGWLNSCWFLTALPQVLTPFTPHDKTAKCHLLPLKDHAWQFIEKDPHGKFVNMEGNQRIEMRHLSQHYANRLWLSTDYTHAIDKLAAKTSTTASDIALRYSEMALPSEAQNGLVYCSTFGMMAKKTAASLIVC
ncbi:MAG TPA: hypothetical protein DF614_03005 [Methylococcaceae bacterium]|nr:hypothetical protein [Methylococcaceae bacterium]